MDRSGAARRPVGGLEDRQPAWSPDATRLLVLSPNPWRLSIIDTASGRRTVVARGESGAWSPDGRSIAYVRFPEDGRDYRIALHVVGADGRGDRRVFENDDTTTYDNGWGTASNGWPRTPIWSPDGSRIFFIRHHERGGTLWSIAVDGDGLRKEADRIERQSRG